MGIRQFSMSPERLPEVRYNVSMISADEATTLAHRVLNRDYTGHHPLAPVPAALVAA